MTKAEKMQMQRIMEKLDCDEEAAKEIIETDKRIDKGEKLFELPEELKQGAKKARMAGNCNGYTKTERAKKVDRQKQFIIETISRALTDHLGGSVHEITHPEREILVEYCNRKFKIVLSCPRS